MINWDSKDQYLSLVEFSTSAEDIYACQLQPLKVSFQASLLQIHY